MERKEDKIMALNTYGERRKYERLFPPSEHWIFYKTEKSAKEQWGFDNSDPMNKRNLLKKRWGFRAWGRVSKK